MFDLACRRGVTLLALALIACTLRAQGDDEELSKMRREFVSSAEQFRLQGGVSGTEPLDFISQPVLSWSNPERRTSAGAMFFWTLGGRPQSAMCMYPTGEATFDIEFQSLSLFPLTARADDGNRWEPAEAGIKFQMISGAPPPGASIPVRLRQMRNLARKFSAKLVPPNQTSIPLRLMSAPIYRYPVPDASSDLIDGSVFSFVQATDPEVLLVIEAVTDDGGDAGWRYALARMSMVPMQVMRGQTLVWEEADWAAMRNPKGVYYVIPKFVAAVRPLDSGE